MTQPESHCPPVCRRGIDDLVMVVLDRPRHENLIADIREAGRAHPSDLRRRSVGGHCGGRAGTGVHAVMGSGGAPEGVLTAAALRCLNGYMLGAWSAQGRAQNERMQAMGIHDLKQIYTPRNSRPARTSSSPPPASPTATCSRCPLLRRRHPHPVDCNDIAAAAGAADRHGTPGE